MDCLPFDYISYTIFTDSDNKTIKDYVKIWHAIGI